MYESISKKFDDAESPDEIISEGKSVKTFNYQFMSYHKFRDISSMRKHPKKSK